MSKKIVLLSDGTGNSASSAHKTNIWRFYKAVDVSQGSDQAVFYDNGVGTSSFTVKRLLGMAFGWGLKNNVKELYGHLCRVYDEGDKIFIYGYSRGAFTARVLAALIADQGIIKAYENEQDLQNEIENAYDSFRHENFVPSLLSAPRWIYHWFTKPKNPESRDSKKRYTYAESGTPLIQLLGVWDTVDAYGAPIDELTRGWDMVIWPLTAKDRNLSKAVGAAYQALALDEQREAFEPMLWNENTSGDRKIFTPDRRVEQVWFAGVHANVGGGNPDDSLAHVSLNWMIQKSNAHGLNFHEEIAEQYRSAANPNGPIYDNRAGVGNIYRYAPRKLEVLCSSSRPGLWNTLLLLLQNKKAVSNDVSIDCPKIHHTVFERIREGGDGYAPINLPERYCVLDAAGKAIEQPDDTHSTRTIESTQQAKARRNLQATAWNKVWLLKLLYFVTLAATATFAVGPYLLDHYDGDNDAAQSNGIAEFSARVDPFIGSIGDIIRLIPQNIGKIPGLEVIENWANLYGNYPYFFVIGLGILAALIYTSNYVNLKLKSEMRTDWAHITGHGNSWADEPVHRNMLVNFLDTHRVLPSNENQIKVSLADGAARLLRLFGEFLSVILFLTVVILVIWKIYFTILDGSGAICPEVQKIGSGEGTVKFDPRIECFDTGFDLKAGQEYRLKMNVGKSWADGSVKADTNGWYGSAPWYAHLATPLRRHLSQDWYQPIVRIGNTWFDRYTASYAKEILTKEPKQEFEKTFIFEARQSGRLYIYLNDAVVPVPLVLWRRDRWYFYRNNCKKKSCELSTLTLTKVPPNGRSSS
jgi:hypothetical protein